MSRLRIRGGHVVPMDRVVGDVEGDVLVVDGRIAEIGPELSTVDAEVIDATGTVVLPGFIDTTGTPTSRSSGGFCPAAQWASSWAPSSTAWRRPTRRS